MGMKKLIELPRGKTKKVRWAKVSMRIPENIHVGFTDRELVAILSFVWTGECRYDLIISDDL